MQIIYSTLLLLHAYRFQAVMLSTLRMVHTTATKISLIWKHKPSSLTGGRERRMDSAVTVQI